MNKVLDVQNLHVSFDTYAGEVKACLLYTSPSPRDTR